MEQPKQILAKTFELNKQIFFFIRKKTGYRIYSIPNYWQFRSVNWKSSFVPFWLTGYALIHYFNEAGYKEDKNKKLKIGRLTKEEYTELTEQIYELYFNDAFVEQV